MATFAPIRPVFRVPAARTRLYASLSSSPLKPGAVGPYQVFDRYAKRLQKDRSVKQDGGTRSRTVDYVREEVADRMIERLLDIKRKFNTILDLGSGPGHFSKLLEPETTKKVVMLDSSSTYCFGQELPLVDRSQESYCTVTLIPSSKVKLGVKLSSRLSCSFSRGRAHTRRRREHSGRRRTQLTRGNRIMSQPSVGK